MAEELHLEAGLFGIHGLDLELLVLHDADLFVTFRFLFNKQIREGDGRLLSVDEFGFILLDLALNGFLHQVDRCIEIVGGVLGADKSALRRNRHLDLFFPFTLAQHNTGFSIIREILFELGELLGDLILESVCKIHVFAGDSYTHNLNSFPYAVSLL